MSYRVAWCGFLALAVALAGCGGGDAAGEPTGVLFVRSGGTGEIFFPRSQSRLAFANSVTVAVRSSRDEPTQFTVFTFFGLSRLNFQEVPEAALVTFVNGLQPNVSSTTFLPSSVVSMALHTGFDRSQVAVINQTTTPLAQDAPVIYERTSNGSFVLEPQPAADTASFTPHTSTDRRARYATLTLTDLDTGDEALLQGAVPYKLSTDVPQQFYGYLGNLGLDKVPAISGGGPPAPPGTTGSGGGGSTGGGDVPPAPPDD